MSDGFLLALWQKGRGRVVPWARFRSTARRVQGTPFAWWREALLLLAWDELGGELW